MSTTSSGNKVENPKSEMERKWFTLSAADYMKIVLGLITGLLSAGIVGWWNAKAPHLTYVVSDPIQFQGEKVQIGIINTLITNDGNKEAEGLECSMRLNGAKIQEVKVSPEHLKPSLTVKDDRFELTLTMLNPSESIQISTLVSNPANMLNKSNVFIRAKGITGDSQPRNALTNWGAALASIASIIAALLGTIAGFLLSRSDRSSKTENQTRKIERALKTIARRTRNEAIEHILSTESGKRLLIRASQYFKPGQEFSRTDLARALGEEEATVFAWIRQIGRPAKKYGIKIFEKHSEGTYSFSESTHATIKQLIEEHGTDWSEYIP